MENSREWVLKRNCSLSPCQMLGAYSALCGVSFAIGCFFTWHGAWYVMCFSLLEMLAVGFAFLLYARHATDRERVILNQDCLFIELVQAEHAQQFRLNPHAIRVEIPVAYHRLVAIKEQGTCVEVGRFLTALKRREFALELRNALHKKPCH
jgi:uncharacterized membrane protein